MARAALVPLIRRRSFRLSSVIALALALSGCGVTAGGITLSLLQDASLTLHTGGHNGAGADPNATP